MYASKICLALILGFLTLSVTEGRAEAQPDHQRLASAVLEGNALYEKGQWSQAREKFVYAYTLRPEPILLYNVANCYLHEGNLKAAADYFDRFNSTAPPDPLPRDEQEARDKAKAHVAHIQAELSALRLLETRAAEKSGEPETPPKVEPATPEPAQPPVGPRTVAEAPRNDQPPPSLVGLDSAAQDDSGNSSSTGYLRTAAWVSVGVGAAGVLGLLSFDQLAKDAVDSKNENPNVAAADRVRRYQFLTNTSLFLAVGGIGASAAFFFLSRSGADEASTALDVSVVPTSGGAAATMGMRF